MGGSCVKQHTMRIDNMKYASFSLPSEQDWIEKAEESLKGKKLETLQKNTYENIVLKPLYSKETQTDVVGYPGASDYRRGSHSVGYYSNPWKVAQKVSYQTVEELQANLTEALERGQTALSFELKKELFETPEQLEQLLNQHIGNAPLAILANGLQKPFLASLISINEISAVSGYVAEDPMSALVEKGTLPMSINNFFDQWAATIQTSDQHLPDLKTVLIDTTPYHNGGANAVQELAIALATGVYYLEELRVRDLEISKLFKKMIFKFQMGANFFMELAKLRAVRVLWDKIGEAYGIPAENRGMEIIAETSSFTKTLNDSHVNILRSGNEAFAAVLGGVQYLQVQAFNELEGITPLAERLARNTQLILKEEAFLQNIVDPAGGSWYIESLTDELIEKAWTYFLSIDGKGGLMQVLESNWLQSEIATVHNNRQQDTFTRKQSIIGTNVYANLQESLKEHLQKKQECFYNVSGSLKELILALKESKSIDLINEQQEFHSIQPIQSQRLSEPFEKLRQRSHHLKLNQVGLICLGELKEYKARADFMTGFLAAGGLKAVRSEGVKSVDEAQSFINDSFFQHYVLCSTNDNYHEIGLEILTKLKQENPEVSFYVAGLLDKDVQGQWLDAGNREFVHVKTNCYEFISSIIQELEEVEHHEQ